METIVSGEDLQLQQYNKFDVDETDGIQRYGYQNIVIDQTITDINTELKEVVRFQLKIRELNRIFRESWTTLS